jgi:ParB family chromosome partitioning protein
MALGRGLGDILQEVEEAYEKNLDGMDSFELEAQGAKVEEIAVDKISPNPFQPRKNFDKNALKELSESIKKHGLLQPIVVIPKDDDYILVAGERRLRAHKLAKLDTIKAIVAEVDMDEFRLRELALIENIQRENLNAIELAHSYAELIEVHSITHEELSHIVNKSRSQITNTLRLLSLSRYAQEQVSNGKLSQGHAKILIGLQKEQEKLLIDSIIGQKLSVRETEKLVKKYKVNNNTKNISQKVLDEGLLSYKKELEKLLPFKHKLKYNKLEITLDNDKDIKKFLKLLKNSSI